MKKGSLLDKALFYVSVPKCISCGKRLSYEDSAFCPECYVEFWNNCSRNCSRCSKVLALCSCSNEYLKDNGIREVIKTFRYIPRDENYTANSLIYSLKRDGRRDVLSVSTELMVASIRNSIQDLSGCVITNVPRRRSAIIQTGIDHASLLAQSVAKTLGAEYQSFLVSKAKKAQRTVDRDQRRKNAAFVIKKEISLGGKTVIIVDDVITTGSSVAAVGKLCRSLGAKHLIAASLAIAYKDEYTPPIYTEY